MDKQLMLFEGRHEVMILTCEDVNFEFRGDFLISGKDVAGILEYAQANDFISLINPKYVYKVKNSDLAKSQNRKLNNAGETFISSFGLNQGLSNSTMPKAEPFQDWVFEDALPSISKYGAYLTPAKVEEVLSDPDTIIRLAMQLKNEREAKRRLEEENAQKQRDLDYKGDVIIGLVDDIDLMEKRQTLNRIMRKPGMNFQDRWSELYYQFEKKYHLDLDYQFEKYNRTHKPKMKGKIDFVEKVLGKLPELYELACKLYVNDVDKLVEEMYGLTTH